MEVASELRLVYEGVFTNISYANRGPANMTECNTTTVDFTPLGRRQAVADF